MVCGGTNRRFPRRLFWCWNLRKPLWVTVTPLIASTSSTFIHIGTCKANPQAWETDVHRLPEVSCVEEPL